MIIISPVVWRLTMLSLVVFFVCCSVHLYLSRRQEMRHKNRIRVIRRLVVKAAEDKVRWSLWPCHAVTLESVHDVVTAIERWGTRESSLSTTSSVPWTATLLTRWTRTTKFQSWRYLLPGWSDRAITVAFWSSKCSDVIFNSVHICWLWLVKIENSKVS